MSKTQSRKPVKSVGSASIVPKSTTYANREEIQFEKRQRSRDTVLTEFIFVLIPFIFLAIISIEDSFTGIFTAIKDLVLGPELALVSSLLFGQTCVKLISGLAKKNIPKWHLGTRKAAGFLALTMICAFLYARISSSNVRSIPYAILQIILFVYSIESFLVFGSIGQRLMDMSETTDSE